MTALLIKNFKCKPAMYMLISQVEKQAILNPLNAMTNDSIFAAATSVSYIHNKDDRQWWCLLADKKICVP